MCQTRPCWPRFAGGNDERNAPLLEPLRRVAAARDATPAQVALAWVHARGGVHGVTVVPLPGTRDRHRLEQNVAAADLALTPDELATLDAIAGRVAGSRAAGLTFAAAGRT